jgi:hypothetical protein
VSARSAASDEALPFLHADRVVRTGVAIVVLFFVGFLGWAAFAPLESAVVTSGIVVPNADRATGPVSIAMRVAPEYADEVAPGMTAKVDLSANKVRRLPMLTGLVTWLSPQALQDPRSGQIYFLARLRLDRASLAELPARMRPGMPVRVEIPTGAHTALEYLVEPIRDVMHNGMREK